MKKNLNSILRKCKSLSMELGRSSPYTSLRRSDSTKLLGVWGGVGRRSRRSRLADGGGDDDGYGEEYNETVIYVGSKRRRYVVNPEFLSHPLLSALIEKSSSDERGEAAAAAAGNRRHIWVRCEVVLFDHLLWMLQSGDPGLGSGDSLEELAELYVF